MRLRVYRRGAHGDAGRRHGELGQTEVENLRLTPIGNEDVRRLDVAMNDALRLCRIERPSNLDA